VKSDQSCNPCSNPPKRQDCLEDAFPHVLEVRARAIQCSAYLILQAALLMVSYQQIREKYRLGTLRVIGCFQCVTVLREGLAQSLLTIDRIART
jgi:hypothetical protein